MTDSRERHGACVEPCASCVACHAPDGSWCCPDSYRMQHSSRRTWRRRGGAETVLGVPITPAPRQSTPRQHSVQSPPLHPSAVSACLMLDSAGVCLEPTISPRPHTRPRKPEAAASPRWRAPGRTILSCRQGGQSTCVGDAARVPTSCANALHDCDGANPCSQQARFKYWIQRYRSSSRGNLWCLI